MPVFHVAHRMPNGIERSGDVAAPTADAAIELRLFDLGVPPADAVLLRCELRPKASPEYERDLSDQYDRRVRRAQRQRIHCGLNRIRRRARAR